MEIRLNFLQGKYNLHIETSKQEHVGLDTWGYSHGDHYVGITFYDVNETKVLQAFAKAFAIEVAEIIQDALAHFANHCPNCDRDLEFAPDTEEVGEWLEKELSAKTCQQGGIDG